MDRGEGISRRQVVTLGLGALLTGATVWDALAMSDNANTGSLIVGARGCCLQGQGAAALIHELSRLAREGKVVGKLIDSSGDDHLDRATGILMADIASRMEVRPGFAFWDDGNSPNAFAMADSWMPRTRGTVLFGRNLLKRSLSLMNGHGDMLVMGICAHEFAHIVQYDHHLHDRLLKNQTTNRKVELHADFLSGYYVGARDIEYSNQQMVALGQSWEGLGDSDFTDEYHHGTRKDRIEASEAGYLMATQHKVGIKEAIEAGMYYLRA